MYPEKTEMINPASNKQQRRNPHFYCAAFAVSRVDDDQKQLKTQFQTLHYVHKKADDGFSFI